MPKKKKSTFKKYLKKHYPKKIREAAEDLRIAQYARKASGEAARGTRANSRARKDYRKADRAFDKAGKRLARLTGYTWN
jgi:hypothetical protein